MGRKVPTVDQWQHKRVIPVPLEDDLTVDFRLPDLGVWIANGRIPNPLVAIAEKLEYGMVDPGRLSLEERKAYYELQAFVIATHVVDPNLVEQCGSEEAAQQWVLDEMPPSHRDQIWLRAFHIIPEEAVASLGDLMRFREDESGAEPADAIAGNGSGT